MRISFIIFPITLVLAVMAITVADESPGFFLKITKNVPRLGRRSDKQFGSYFFKNTKQIPRMGRRNDVNDSPTQDDEISRWLNEMGPLNKRAMINPILSTGHQGYSVVQPVNANTLIELLEKDAIPSNNIKFVHWKDFDRALQTDTDLYFKVISLGRNPDRQLKEDLDINRFVPFFRNTNPDDDLMFYRGEKEMYPSREKDLLHYNNV